MNFLPYEIIRLSWLGFGLFCAIVALLGIVRESRIRVITPQLARAMVVIAGILFVLTLLATNGPESPALLQWIATTGGDPSFTLALLPDYEAGWFLALIALITAPSVFRREFHAYLPAGVAFAFTGVLLSLTSQSVWAAILGWSFLAASPLVMRLGLAGPNAEASRFLTKEAIQKCIFLIVLWVSALGLETLGFKWDFSQMSSKDGVVEILIGFFFFALTAFCLPWLTLSSVTRLPEPEETEVLLFSRVFLPLAVAVALNRWCTQMVSAHAPTLAGYWTTALSILFFVVYLAAKSRIERLRAITLLFGTLALSAVFLFPGWGAIFLILGCAAVLSILIVGTDGLPRMIRQIFLLAGVGAVAGFPGFLPSVLIHRLWAETSIHPLECGSLLLGHAFFTIALLREAGVQFFAGNPTPEGSSRVPVGRIVPYLFTFLLILTPWTTATLTGGILDAEYDALPFLQGLPWAKEYAAWVTSLSSEDLFLEGRWVQIALSVVVMLLLILFRGNRDVFESREGSWAGVRRTVAMDFGASWLGSQLLHLLGQGGSFLNTRVLTPLWDRGLPEISERISRGKTIASFHIERVAEAFTGDRWESAVSAPAFLIQSMTNGRSSWYLFFTILGTFLLVLHFVVKHA